MRTRLAWPEGVAKIHEASLDILEEVGVRVPSKTGRKVLADHGCTPASGETIVKLPRAMVLEALSRAPRSFTLAGRDVADDLVVGSGRSHLATDGCVHRVIDFESGIERHGTTADVAAMAQIADALPSIDIVSPMAAAEDQPPSLRGLHEVAACLANTSKHVLFVRAASAAEVTAIVELAAVVAGDDSLLRRRPIISALVPTASPLGLDGGALEAGLAFGRHGIPVGYYSLPLMAINAPLSVAGCATVYNTEIIAAIVIHQLASPGAPVFYAAAPGSVSLKTAEFVAGTPESVLARALVPRLAAHSGLPSVCGGDVTAAKTPDSQAAWENAAGMLTQTLAGADVLFGAGLLDGSQILAYEQLVIENELAGMVRRLTEGVNVDDETLALPLIKEMAFRGDYLGTRHTRDHGHALWTHGQMGDHGTFAGWDAAGRPDAVDQARQEVRRILGPPAADRTGWGGACVTPEQETTMAAVIARATEQLS